jgi:peroxiredoxin
MGQIPNEPQDVSPLLIGEHLPELTVKSAKGNTVALKSVIKKQPTVLLFYRGGWCPYCTAHLSEIQKVEDEIINLGYQIVAISPDSPENLISTGDKKDIKYQLYSDSSGELIKAMGIGFKAPQNYHNFLSEKSGGVNKTLLPVPSVFVIDTEGKIRFEYINPDYKTRLSDELLVAVLKNLQ